MNKHHFVNDYLLTHYFFFYSSFNEAASVVSQQCPCKYKMPRKSFHPDCG